MARKVVSQPARPAPQSTTPTTQELEVDESVHRSGTTTVRAVNVSAPVSERARPTTPNMQLYSPQLTSVLSIVNRITGVVVSLAAVGLVTWLIAGAVGPKAYAAVHGAIFTWIGQIVLFVFTFAFFLHLCLGVRHLVWDTVHAFELRQIYLGGWIAVAASIVLTIAAWVLAYTLGS